MSRVAESQVLKYGKRDELVALLAKALKHTPRRWLTHGAGVPVRRYRFGLSFPYTGPFPAAVHRLNMPDGEMRAMLQLHAEPKITLAALKDELRNRSLGPLTGDRAELLQKLR